MSRFSGKTAVVTGGNSGIGLGIAKQLAAEGAKLAVFGRNAETLAQAGEELGSGTLTVQGDIRKLADIDRLFDNVRDRFGTFDVLVANAGWGAVKPFVETDEEAFDVSVETNLKGTFFTIQKALPLMKAGGSIVVIGSVAGVKAFPGMSAYSASKAGVRSLVRTLTVELAPQGIRINNLSPGAIDTPAFGRMPGLEREMLGGFKEMVPIGRVGTPEDMASVAVFLASDDASYISGADIMADGGFAQV